MYKKFNQRFDNKRDLFLFLLLIAGKNVTKILFWQKQSHFHFQNSLKEDENMIHILLEEKWFIVFMSFVVHMCRFLWTKMFMVILFIVIKTPREEEYLDIRDIYDGTASSLMNPNSSLYRACINSHKWMSRSYI